ncbi:hypothetical protein STEG23_014603, partial [Scotinomys teguina]
MMPDEGLLGDVCVYLKAAMTALDPVEMSALNGMLTHVTCAMEASTCHHIAYEALEEVIYKA